MILEKIYLSWRKARGEDRYLIGVLQRQPKGITFIYSKEEAEAARKAGFINYPDFPIIDFSKEYTGDLKGILSLRLMPATRPDRENYLSFWDANNINYDWFDELGFTQGKLATDNFEFLAAFPYHENGLKFVTDIAALTHIKVPNDKLFVNDELSFELDINNVKDSKAVKVFKEDIHIGYIKRGHNLFFENANPNRLRLLVKHVEKNGNVSQIFVSVLKT
jgi:hypothetical protein